MTAARHDDPDELAAAILAELAGAPAGAEVPVARLTKQFGLGASALLRELASMSDARIAGVTGPGWVRVTQQAGRWVVALTDAGRERVAR